jgi:hypothetical protein
MGPKAIDEAKAVAEVEALDVEPKGIKVKETVNEDYMELKQANTMIEVAQDQNEFKDISIKDKRDYQKDQIREDDGYNHEVDPDHLSSHDEDLEERF